MFRTMLACVFVCHRVSYSSMVSVHVFALYLQNANCKLFTALQLAIVGLQVLVAGSNGLRSEGQPGQLVAFKYPRFNDSIITININIDIKEICG